MIESRQWHFRVSCQLQPGEQICLVGSCESLGSWDAKNLIILQKDNDLDDIFSTFISIPLSQVEYRYCVCYVLEPTIVQPERLFIIRRWETNIIPRKVPEGASCSDDGMVDQFGEHGGFDRYDEGWLVHDSMVQLKFCKSNLYNDPVILWKRKYYSKPCRLKVTPFEIEKHNGIEPSHPGNIIEESTEVDITDLRGNSRAHWPSIEVAVMKEGACKYERQEQFGVFCDNEDYIVFKSRMLNQQSIGFLVDFYIEDVKDDIPKYIGCSFILPSNMRENFGVATIPITSPKHIPIGQLTVHYMVVHPMTSQNTDMRTTYARYWKDSWKGLEVGHRGAGNSYHSQPKSCANIRENTIASLKYAAESGADMVEFDVQLSRDHIPVIYHDFHACIALKRKKEQDQTDLLEIPIKDLTIQQLQALKVYHVKEKGASKFLDEEFEDHQPFPTLQRALDTVPTFCGFNIEVKWTMQMKDGTYELQHPFELNYFLDLILKMVLEKSGCRKIVFSCFHPDICTMLRMKQNHYPVLYLTQGVSEQWPPYDDQLTTTIKHAIIYASSANILGINVHTEDLLRDPEQMTKALAQNLIVFCWGDHNNDIENIRFLKNLGMHGIIYDKIDVYNTKEKKESVFLYEEISTEESVIKAAGGGTSALTNWKPVQQQQHSEDDDDGLSSPPSTSESEGYNENNPTREAQNVRIIGVECNI